MSESTLRTAIYNVVNGVSNVGSVYNRERWAAEWSAYLDLYKTTIGATAQIRGWTVSCAGFKADQLAIKKLVKRTYTFKVRGYLGMDDSAATETTAIALAETVLNALDDSSTVHAGANHAGYASLDVFELRLFGGVLCHYVEITQSIMEVREASV